MKIILPFNVKKIIDTIEEAGYEAYAVGGCIRDCVLGREPNDWDITTSAKPEVIKSLFYRTIDTGLEHGTVTVLMEKTGYEVTTYRIDGEYEDHRRPKEVEFTSNLVEDLKRRDFTINAMAYNEKEGLVDIFGGINDINHKIIRCVGNSEERFQEDALRMLRAVRFSAQLGFEIEEETCKAIKKLRKTLVHISAERIQVELVKLLISNHPEYIKKAYELGITEIIMPEFDDIMKVEQNHPHHMYSVGEHSLVALINIQNNKALRISALFHDLGKSKTLKIDEDNITHFHGHPEESEKLAKNILKRLKFDNDTIKKVCKLVKYHDYGNSITPTLKSVRRAVFIIGMENMDEIFLLKEADVLAQSLYQREEKLEKLEQWKEIYEIIKKEKHCVQKSDLEVTGKDLMELGMKQGKEIGEALDYLLEIVLDDHTKNEKNFLLTQIKNRN